MPQGTSTESDYGDGLHTRKKEGKEGKGRGMEGKEGRKERKEGGREGGRERERERAPLLINELKPGEYRCNWILKVLGPGGREITFDLAECLNTNAHYRDLGVLMFQLRTVLSAQLVE